MPAYYMHYKFGKLVEKALDAETVKFLAENRDLFETGFQGPDILFFYRPVLGHPICTYGQQIHHAPGRKLFEEAAKRISKETDPVRRGKALAYGAGVVCHLALDAACHPHIEAFIGESGISHHEIEKELDKYFLKQEGKDPFQLKLTEHFAKEADSARIIAIFYGLKKQDIAKALGKFSRLQNLFYTTSEWIRKPVFAAMKVAGVYAKTRGFFANQKDNPACSGFNRAMEREMLEAVPVAASMIRSYLDWSAGKGTLPETFERTFSV